MPEIDFEMKILLLANKFPYPPKDGGVIAKLAMIKGLHELGHTLTVLAINTSKHFTRMEDVPEQIKKLADFRDVFINTDIKATKALKNLFFSKLPYNAERFISKEYEAKLIEVLQETEFDVVQLETLYMCPYIPIIRKYSKATISYRAHNIESEIWKRVADNEKSKLKKYYSNLLARRIEAFEKSYINKYDCVVPITAKDEENLNAMGNTKPSLVCPTGITAYDYKPQTKNKSHTIFHLGGLDWPPNQQGLAWFIDECWPKLREKHPELKFHVGGRNVPDWLDSKFNKTPQLIFDGEVANALTYIREKGIMIAPLFSGSGMRIKIIEGLALGKPIVATSIGAEGIHYTPDENICIADNAEDFVNKIDFLLKNGTSRTKIAENAVKFVRQEYDNKKITERLSNFYKLQNAGES